jgi:hypothetical protein
LSFPFAGQHTLHRFLISTNFLTCAQKNILPLYAQNSAIPEHSFFLISTADRLAEEPEKNTFRYPTVLLSRHMANGVPYNCTHRLLTVTGESQM